MFILIQVVLPSAADGPTHYLCSCQGGNRRRSLPEAPAHHCPLHNNSPPPPEKAVTQSVIFCLHPIKLQLNGQIQECLEEKGGEGQSEFYLKTCLTAACIICTGNHLNRVTERTHGKVLSPSGTGYLDKVCDV